MKENEILQEDFLKESEKESKRQKSEPKTEPKPEPVKKLNRWIDNEAKGVKKCPDCGGEIMGWAYRQNFNYCPWCKAENFRE